MIIFRVVCVAFPTPGVRYCREGKKKKKKIHLGEGRRANHIEVDMSFSFRRSRKRKNVWPPGPLFSGRALCVWLGKCEGRRNRVNGGVIAPRPGTARQSSEVQVTARAGGGGGPSHSPTVRFTHRPSSLWSLAGRARVRAPPPSVAGRGEAGLPGLHVGTPGSRARGRRAGAAADTGGSGGARREWGHGNSVWWWKDGTDR